KARQLRRGSGLARAVETDNQNAAVVFQMEWCGIASEQRSQFVMENFYDLLSGRDAADNRFTQRLLLHAGDKFSGDLKIDIRFEQRQAHLAQSSVDIRLADNPMPTEIFENLLKLVAKLWKHNLITRSRRRDRQHPRRTRSQNYLFGIGVPAGGAAAASSIPKVQCASTFLPADFALTNTLHDLSRSFCVT